VTPVRATLTKELLDQLRAVRPGGDVVATMRAVAWAVEAITALDLSPLAFVNQLAQRAHPPVSVPPPVVVPSNEVAEATHAEVAVGRTPGGRDRNSGPVAA
jgi:hypothetical protein